MVLILYNIRFLKAKYFPRGSFCNAKPKMGSYAWKSILKPRKVIIMGAKWRIRDGATINIFKNV